MGPLQTIGTRWHLHSLYAAAYPDHRLVIVHSQQSLKERENLQRYVALWSRIIVCVDMLGEGFDLPELKIAALHDHHKSVAVTIQFVGRFTRRDPTGCIDGIANTGIDDAQDRALAKLYAEDADWNALVELSSAARLNVSAAPRYPKAFRGRRTSSRPRAERSNAVYAPRRTTVYLRNF